jgi:hypothetical protein
MFVVVRDIITTAHSNIGSRYRLEAAVRMEVLDADLTRWRVFRLC